jgi:hypothetical protein
MRALLLLAVVALAAGCSRSALLEHPDASVPDEVMRGTMRPDCAPDDGPAVRFDFAPEAFACDVVDIAVTLTVSVWSGSPLDLRTYQVGAFGVGDAQAVRCVPGAACEAASSGTLVLERYDIATSAAGTYELTFPSGLTVRGGFHTTWCDVSVLCG